MAFTGSPVIQQISDRTVRITGVSLAFGASGILGLHGGAVGGAVALPASFKPHDYHYQPTDNDVSFQESVRVTINPVTDVSNFGIPIRVVKTGTVVADFAITLTNDAAGTGSGDLEIYVTFRD